jgi:lipid-binding SYLF domain-containing protein
MREIVLVFLMFLLVPAAAMAEPTPAEQRAKLGELRSEALNQLYKEEPSARGLIQKAVGYAVFSNTGINVLLLSTGRGAGIAHDNKSGKDTYMKMFSAGAGVGMGIKKFRAVFVFQSRDAFTQFVEKGWDLSGQADAAATTDADANKGAGAVDESLAMMPGVTVYQMTDKGLALQATLQGTKYWKDDDLN